MQHGYVNVGAVQLINESIGCDVDSQGQETNGAENKRKGCVASQSEVPPPDRENSQVDEEEITEAESVKIEKLIQMPVSCINQITGGCQR